MSEGLLIDTDGVECCCPDDVPPVFFECPLVTNEAYLNCPDEYHPTLSNMLVRSYSDIGDLRCEWEQGYSYSEMGPFKKTTGGGFGEWNTIHHPDWLTEAIVGSTHQTTTINNTGTCNFFDDDACMATPAGGLAGLCPYAGNKKIVCLLDTLWQNQGFNGLATFTGVGPGPINGCAGQTVWGPSASLCVDAPIGEGFPVTCIEDQGFFSL